MRLSLLVLGGLCISPCQALGHCNLSTPDDASLDNSSNGHWCTRNIHCLEVSNLDSSYLNCDQALTIKDTMRKRIIGRKLSAVIRLTKSFIHGESLDIREFESSFEEIEDMLWELSILLTDLETPDLELFEHYLIAKDLFWRLKGLIAMLDFYSLHKHGGHRLVHYVVRSNIVLAGLSDEFGDPDPTKGELSHLVWKYKQLLGFWKWEFDHLQEKEAGIIAIFSSQYMLAHIRIKILEASLPEWIASRG